MTGKNVNPLFLLGLIGFFVIGSIFISDVLSAFFGDKEIYWTHQSMQLSLDETTNEFQLFIGGKSLKNHLRDQTLSIADNGGTQRPVVDNDVSARVNNWNNIKSQILTKAAFTGILFGIMITMLTIGLVQMFIRKKTEQKEDEVLSANNE